MHKQLDHLREQKIIREGTPTVILDSTDGCSGQYRSALSLFLLTVVSASYNIVIDRMVNAPAHGKGVVDALNAVTKRYLRECMRRICKVDTGNENDVELKRKFENWMHIGDKQKSFAEQAKKLCEDEDRKDGVKSAGPKRQKRMQNKKINK